MVDHIVLLALRPDVPEAELTALSERIARIPEEIDGIEAVRSGRSTSPEGLEQGHDFGFVITFTDSAARDAYLPHPAHVPLSEHVQRLAERVLVFDV